MNLNIQNNQFPNLIEIWIVGSNSVEVITKNQSHYKIIAKENIRSNAQPNYYAAYECLQTMLINNEEFDLWYRDNSLPWQNGNTIEECVMAAMRWVDEQR